jgi:negative regulator of sigma-B (phosphoserine phosphatase)
VAEWPDALERGVAEQAMPGQTRSGDRAVLAPYEGGALVGAIDGLGHGPDAADAAARAAEVLGATPAEHPAALVQRCHKALTRTRGAVMTLAWIDVAERTLRWTAIGNVEGRLVRAGAGPRVPTEGAFMRGGVVGYKLPDVRVTSTQLRDGDVVVLATDGVASSFGAAVATGGGAQELADRILADHARGTDDALVVVVRFRAVE